MKVKWIQYVDGGVFIEIGREYMVYVMVMGTMQ